MTAPIPPTSAAMAGTAAEKFAAVDASSPMDIQAPLEDLSGITAQAEAAGKAWNAGAAKWSDSPQGAGSDGFTLAGDHPSGADGDWPVDMSFSHEGP